MKKIVLSSALIFSILISSGIGFASELYSQKLRPVRDAKNAKQKVLNSQIEAAEYDIDRTLTNPKLSTDQKYKRVQADKQKIENLKKQRKDLNKRYKAQKKAIKKKYNY